MLYFHYLLWLKGISSFSDVRKRIVKEESFHAQLLSFLNQNIRCELSLVDSSKFVPMNLPSTRSNDKPSVFISYLNHDANLVIS